MGYFRTLDEYPEEALERELQTRRERREVMLCDYCMRPFDTAPCRFPDRHKPEQAIRERAVARARAAAAPPQ